MKVGIVIRRERMKRRLSQADLARELSITQPYLSQMESGAKMPSMQLIADIAYYFDMPLGALLLLTITEADVAEKDKAIFKQKMPLFQDFLAKIEFVVQ